MKYFILLLPFLWMACSQSKNQTPVVTKDSLKIPNLQKANSDLSLPSLFTQSFSEQEINSCIEASCGPARDEVGMWRSSYFKPESSDSAKLWTDKIAPEVHTSIQSTNKSAKLLAEKLDVYLKTNPQIKPDLAIRAFINYSLLIQKTQIAQNMPFSVSSSTGRVVVNEDAVQKFKQNLSADEGEALELIVSKILLPAEQDNQSQSLVNKVAARAQARYPTLKTSDAIIKDAKDLLAKQQAIASSTGAMLVDNLLTPNQAKVLDRATKGMSLSANDSDAYIEAARTLDVVAPIFVGDVFTALMKLPLGMTNDQILQKARENNNKNMTDLNSDHASILEAKIDNACRNRLALLSQMQISANQSSTFFDVEKKVKLAAIKVATHYIDRTEISALTDKINSIEFAPPKAFNDQILEFEAILDGHKGATQKQLDALSAGDETLLQNLVLMIATSDVTSGQSNSTTAAQDPDADNEVLKYCSNPDFIYFNDSTLSSSGQIQVSWVTIEYPSVGAGILAHEIGHVVSYALRESYTAGTDRSFRTSLACVSNRNPFVITPVSINSSSQDTQWSEEDWADHFSSMTMNEIAANGSLKSLGAKNIMCGVVQNNGTKYLNNNIEPGASDTHSSALLRLVMIGEDQSTLPAACASLTDYAVPNGRSLTCQ